MGEVHALAWRTSGAELTGCTSANRAQSRAMAERHKITAYADFADLVNNVDVVDICTPTPLHKQMVLAAAKSGKHVICEKPIAMTLEDAHTMVDACDAAGVRFFVGMVVRFFPQYRLVKELVAKGQIGQLGVLRLKRVAYVPHKPADNWYIDETRFHGRVSDAFCPLRSSCAGVDQRGGAWRHTWNQRYQPQRDPPSPPGLVCRQGSGRRWIGYGSHCASGRSLSVVLRS